MQRGGGREVGGRWANGEGGGTVSVWVSGLGGTYLERGRVEGGWDMLEEYILVVCDTAELFILMVTCLSWASSTLSYYSMYPP